MILEDEEDADLDFSFDVDQLLSVHCDLSYEDLIMGTVQIENQDTHYSLRGDLIEHH